MIVAMAWPRSARQGARQVAWRQEVGLVQVYDQLSNTQVVASASDKGGQIGVVTGATTVLDLVKLDERGEVVEAFNGVSPSRLRRVRALVLGDLVVSGPWLGQVSDVSVDVMVSFDDGAVCMVADAEMLQVAAEYRNHQYLPQRNSRFYPGLRVGRSTVFKDGRWLRGHWNADRDVAIGIVVKVEMSSVLVHWIASTHCGTDRLLVEESAPPAYQNPHDLTFFCVAYNNYGWAPADRCFFTRPGPTSTHGDRQLEEEQQHDGCFDKLELPMTVAKTRTYVDVLWQDGTQQHGVSSVSMVPLHIINDQDFLPGHHGHVSWFKATACPSEAREVECNETVSAYDLEPHPDDLPKLGDIVVRLLPSGSSDRGTTGSPTRTGSCPRVAPRAGRLGRILAPPPPPPPHPISLLPAAVGARVRAKLVKLSAAADPPLVSRARRRRWIGGGDDRPAAGLVGGQHGGIQGRIRGGGLGRLFLRRVAPATLARAAVAG
ncbi:hypothetical protein QYE76_008216 [Lolium multiflorum]|uniref:Uncharacterized protein n=1 Tax=Lolium multiflorum TaxID=4521 RepID=A0AAD8VD89_LOLMU|nr:hypothetical protein QYE76_008216 [Lolium multiflorum]